AGLARVALAGKVNWSQLGKAAAAAGLSAAEAAAWLRGETLLPSRQSVALVSAVLEQARAQQVNYMTQLRQGHAGGAAMGASYQAKVAEKVTLPRGGTEDSTWIRGGPAEVTAGEVEATLGRLKDDFPGWKFDADGVETLAAGKPKLTWYGRRPAGRDADEWAA